MASERLLTPEGEQARGGPRTVAAPGPIAAPGRRPKRVLQVFPYYLSPELPNVSGVKTSLLNLIRGLTARRVGSIVLVPASNPLYDEDFFEAGADDVVELGIKRHLVFERHQAGPAYLAKYPARLLAETRVLARRLPDLDIDLVHSHGSAFVGACRAARLAHVPSVLHVHEDIVRLPPWAQRTYLRRAPYLADLLVCCAEYLRDRFLFAGAPRDRCIAVPNSVDTERFSPVGARPLRDELGLAPTDVLVGFVGRLVPGKDPARFISAARLVARQELDARFVIVGAADHPAHNAYVRDLHAAALDPALAGRLTFAGSRKDMPDVYRSLDALVMCSHNEAMPNSVLEAMSSGVAIVDQSGGGGPEALGYGAVGRIVPGKEAPALASALGEVVREDHLRHNLGRAARRRAEEVYSERTMTESMLAAYSRVLGTEQTDRAKGDGR